MVVGHKRPVDPPTSGAHLSGQQVCLIFQKIHKGRQRDRRGYVRAGDGGRGTGDGGRGTGDGGRGTGDGGRGTGRRKLGKK